MESSLPDPYLSGAILNWVVVSSIFLFSPRTLGKRSNLTCAYFSNGLVQPPTTVDGRGPHPTDTLLETNKSHLNITGWKMECQELILNFGAVTVDGRNPAPPEMYKTLQIMG